MKLFVHEMIHAVSSLLVGSAGLFFSGSIFIFAAAIIVGVGLDIDHFFDYAHSQKGKKLNISNFFRGRYFFESKKIYVFFHAYEWVIFLAIIALAFSVHTVLFLTLACSILFHLLYDWFTYRPKWKSYFLFYRVSRQFSHNALGFHDCQ